MAGNSIAVFPDDNVELLVWAAQLLVDFNAQNIIPTLDREEDWRKWGNIVATSQQFERAGTPPTDGFDTWRDWAKHLYSIL